MSAIAVSAGALDAARRRALLELVRRELRAAHAGLRGAGIGAAAVSRMLDERISLLTADSLLAAERRALARSAHRRSDDDADLVEDVEDTVNLNGVGQ
jgi:hypothetical protein